MKRSKGAVACGNAGTADSAIEVLRAGGNAVDAAIAAFFSACVHEPVLASLGGGGFSLCRINDAAPVMLDFFTQTPVSRCAPDELDFESVQVDFGAATQSFHIGFGAIATPGAAKGMFEMHRRFGRMPLTELVVPTLDAIRRRPPLCELQADILKVVEPIYMTRMSARQVFQSPTFPGHVLQAGDLLCFDELAAFIEVLAGEGDAMFYLGEVAALVERQCRAHGGSLTREDFRHYEAVWRTPLSCEYRDTRIWLNPPPSVGGTSVLFALELLKSQPPSMDDLCLYGILSEAMGLTDDACLKSVNVDSRRALDAYLGEDVARLHVEQLHHRARAWRGTTHVSVIDAAGNLVAMTVSNGEGCGEIVPGTGIMLNNMLGEEALNPGGFHCWPLDTRMSSMMAPTLIEWPGAHRAILGSGGSNRIWSAILQVIVQLVDRGLDPRSATLAPRIHVENDTVSIEGGISDHIRGPLKSRYGRHEVFDGLNFYFGGVHGIVSIDGLADGAGDPRRAGVYREL